MDHHWANIDDRFLHIQYLTDSKSKSNTENPKSSNHILGGAMHFHQKVTK